jgi:hypothetical protein
MKRHKPVQTTDAESVRGSAFWPSRAYAANRVV